MKRCVPPNFSAWLPGRHVLYARPPATGRSFRALSIDRHSHQAGTRARREFAHAGLGFPFLLGGLHSHATGRLVWTPVCGSIDHPLSSLCPPASLDQNFLTSSARFSSIPTTTGCRGVCTIPIAPVEAAGPEENTVNDSPSQAAIADAGLSSRPNLLLLPPSSFFCRRDGAEPRGESDRAARLDPRGGGPPAAPTV